MTVRYNQSTLELQIEINFVDYISSPKFMPNSVLFIVTTNYFIRTDDCKII